MIELNTSADLRHLLDSLSKLDDLYSLPVRYQIAFSLRGIIKSAGIYVDQWPQFNCVCALNLSSEFLQGSDRFDFDAATIYRLPAESKNNMDENRFEKFVGDLASERKWTDGSRSLYASYVLLDDLVHFENVLGPFGKVDSYHGSSGYIFYTAMNDESNMEKYDQRLGQLEIDLPPNLRADTLRPSDADQLTKSWQYGPPDVVPPFFRWTIEKFPSICLRERSTDRLVAWVAQYSCGAAAHLFIDEEYRGRGLSEYLWLEIGKRIKKFTPSIPLYFDIDKNNIISLKSSKKAFSFDHESGEKLTTWFFFYNEKAFPK